MSKIFFLTDYIWDSGELVSEGKKNFKIRIHSTPYTTEQTKYVLKEKCAMPDESVCIIWETWKGKNGRGGYRVERDLYPDDRVRADHVYYQHVGGRGRRDEIEYGVLR